MTSHVITLTPLDGKYGTAEEEIFGVTSWEQDGTILRYWQSGKTALGFVNLQGVKTAHINKEK